MRRHLAIILALATLTGLGASSAMAADPSPSPAGSAPASATVKPSPSPNFKIKFSIGSDSMAADPSASSSPSARIRSVGAGGMFVVGVGVTGRRVKDAVLTGTYSICPDGANCVTGTFKSVGKGKSLKLQFKYRVPKTWAELASSAPAASGAPSASPASHTLVVTLTGAYAGTTATVTRTFSVKGIKAPKPSASPSSARPSSSASASPAG